MPMQPVNISNTGYQMFLDDESVFAPRERGLERQAKQNALARQTAVRNALAQSINPKTGLTNYEFAQQIGGVDIAPELQAAQQADMMARADYNKKLADIASTNATAGKTASDQQIAEINEFATYLAPVRDQAGFTAWRTPYVEKYPFLDAMIPTTYSHEIQNSILQKTKAKVENLSFQNAGDFIYPLNAQTGAQVGTPIRVGKSPNVANQNINLKMPPLQTSEQGKKGEINADMYKGARETAIRGRKALAPIDTALGVLDKGFTTGVGTDTKRKITGVLSALGIPEAEEYANDATRFNAAVKEAVLARQVEQKGPQTDQDSIRIEQASAGLSNPTAANRFWLNLAKAQIKRDVAYERFLDKWWNSKPPNERSFEGAEEAWYGGEGGKSLFLDPALAKYAPKEEQASAAAPAAAAPAAAATPAALPANVAAQLQEGFNTTFSNNQVWTLRNGKPARVK